jgi:hypothetical protein
VYKEQRDHEIKYRISFSGNKNCKRTGMPPMRDTIGSSRSSCNAMSPLGIPSSTVVSTSVRALSFSESESDPLS